MSSSPGPAGLAALAEPSGLAEPSAPVVVVGGGLAGIACARKLHDAGYPVVVHERGHQLGGRMAVRTEELPSGPHAVDIGAPYFTVRDERFAAVAAAWEEAGLASVWTDTFVVATPDGRMSPASSTARWSASGGMRSLVQDLAHGLDVRLEHEVQQVGVGPAGLTVDGDAAAAVVLAMPDPQAARLVTGEVAAQLGISGQAWAPALSVWSAWPERWWPEFDAAFVDGSAVLSWVSDDGRSRGDQAPVLVAHTTGEYAAQHLDDVQSAVGTVLAELPRVLRSGSGSPSAAAPEPLWARVHRWSLASSRHPHPAPFALAPFGGAFLGVCGDGWGKRSRVEQAWLSGDALASAMLNPIE